MTRRIFLGILLIGLSNLAMAQDEEWVMRAYASARLMPGYLSGTWPDDILCFGDVRDLKITMTFNGETYEEERPGINPNDLITLIFEVTSSNGTFSGPLKVVMEGYCTCYDAVDCAIDIHHEERYRSDEVTFNISHIASDGPDCYREHAVGTDNGIDFGTGYTIGQRLSTPEVPPSIGCGESVQISTSTVLEDPNSYLWRVSDDPGAASSYWKTIPDKDTQTITVDYDDLNSPNFTSSARYVRVFEYASCSRPVSPVSNSFWAYLEPPTISGVGWTEPSCFGYDDGQVTFDVDGQVNNYLVTLNKLDPSDGLYKPFYQRAYAASQFPVTINKSTIVGSGQQTSGINRGDWQVVVSNNENIDNLGSCEANVNRTVLEPTEVVADASITSNFSGYSVSCQGSSNGSARVIASGGTPGYTYSWSNGLGQNTISNLSAQKYVVTVTDTKGCSKKDSVTLTQPNPIAITFPPGSIVTPTCAESSDGSITAAATGGAGTLTYSWPGQSGATAGFLPEGNHVVTVTDANNCSQQSSFFLDAPPALIAYASVTSNYDGYGVKCFESTNGSAKVDSVQLGTSPFDYSWSNGDSEIEAFNLAGGQSYTVSITDHRGCIANTSVNVTRPNPFSVEVTPASNYNGSFIQCNGDANGILTSNVLDDLGNPASAEYYQWFRNNQPYLEGFTLNTIDQLEEGSYRLVITYNTECLSEYTYQLNDPEPIEPAIVAISNYNGQPISCSGQDDAILGVTFAIAGGTGSYQYNWSTEDTTPTISQVAAGTYEVTITDENDCSGFTSYDLQDPEPVEAVITDFSDYTSFGVSCFGDNNGYINTATDGGTGVYTFSWSGIPDATSNVSNLQEGNYQMVVRDNNGCADSVQHTITQPPALALSIPAFNHVSCFNGTDGSVTLLPGGGAGSYSYSHDNMITWSTDSIYNNLSAGPHTFILRDDNGCTIGTSATLTSPSQINIQFENIQTALCSNAQGSATAIVSGGKGGYRYQWFNPRGTFIGNASSLNNLPGGIYTLSVRDDNSCVVSAQVPIRSDDGPSTTWNATPVNCFNSMDGSASITVTGSEPFVVNWPNGQTGLTASNLSAGPHLVSITDAANCTTAETVVVPSPEALSIQISNISVPTCSGFCDGQMTLTPVGGAGGYTMEWNGSSNATQSQLCAGLYTVTLSDQNGCTLIENMALQQPDSLLIAVSNETLATCADGCDGALEINATGGNGGYTFVWPDGSTGSIKSSLCPGSYQVVVTDNQGCEETRSVVLNNTLPVPIDLGEDVTLCTGQTHTLDVGPNWNGHTWTSSNGLQSTQQSITIVDPGQYWIEVISQQGCVGRDTFLLKNSNDLLQASFMIAQEAIIGDTVVIIDISWPLPQSLEWHYPGDMNIISDRGDVLFGQFTEVGEHQVGITVRLGECVDELYKTITILEDGRGDGGGRLGYVENVIALKLYPNPNNGQFKVEVELLNSGPLVLSIWNTPSNLLVHTLKSDPQKFHSLELDLRPLTAGSYLIRLDHEKGAKYLRFVAH